MSHELHYTSLPAGLKPGSNGFCTVAATAGLPGATAQRMEMLSGYRDLYPPGDARAARNPVAWSHWRLSPGGRAPSILSRVASAGMDYTGRANTYAHHLLLDPAEQPPAGPAWAVAQPGVLDVAWAGAPRTLPAGRAVPRSDDPPAACAAWAAATGDAGWAGVLAATAAADVPRVAYLIYDPAAGHDPLPLLREAMALLPPARRWPVAFTTYFTDLPAGLACHWRCCVANTPAAKDARRNATSGVVLDLTTALGDAPETALVRLARTGHVDTPAAITSGAGTLTPVANQGPFDVDDDAVLPDSMKPMPLPIGAAAAGRLTPRRPTLAPLGGGGAADGRPSLPMATLVGPDAADGSDSDRPASAGQASKRGLWLWVAAFGWPLLALAGMSTWYLVTSGHVTDLKQKLSDAVASSGRLAEEKTAIAHELDRARSESDQQSDDAKVAQAKAAATAEGLRKQLHDAETDRGEAAANVERLTGRVKSLEASVADKRPATPGSATQKATPPAAVVAAAMPRADAPSAVFRPSVPLVPADPFDDRRALYVSDVPIDSVAVFGGLAESPVTVADTSSIPAPSPSEKVVTWTGTQPPPVGSPGGMSPTTVRDRFGRVTVEHRLFSWVVYWRWEARPADGSQEKLAVKKWLQYAGVRVVARGREAVMIPLGDPTTTFFVAASDAVKLPDLPALKEGERPTPVVDRGQNTDWEFHVDPGKPSVVVAESHSTQSAEFNVTIDYTKAEASSDYSAILAKWDGDVTRLESVAVAHDGDATAAAKEAAGYATAPDKEKAADEAKRLDKLRDAKGKETTAKDLAVAARKQKELPSALQKALRAVKPFSVLLQDPKTGLVIRILTVTPAAQAKAKV